MSQWINVELEDWPKSSSSAGQEIGADLTLSSPYDVPTAFRANRKGREFSIEFRYIDNDEPRVPEALDEASGVEIGRRSHRLFGVRLLLSDAATSNPVAVDKAKQIVSGIMTKAPKGSHQLDNIKIVDFLIGKHERVLSTSSG